jgi:hypothetical protein
MRQFGWVVLAAATVAGCGGRKDAEVAADTVSRDIQLLAPDSTVALNDVSQPPARVDTVFIQNAPASRPKTPAPRPTPAPAPPPATAPAPEAAPAPAPPAPAPGAAQLEAGTAIGAVAISSITSRSNKPGETLAARIDEAITTAAGRVVIPAGSVVSLTIVALKPAPNKSATDGTVELRVTEVVINGVSHPIDAKVAYVEHTLKGRGVTGSEAAKVGVGAAAGAILGKVIGGKTGAVAGGVTGAAAGAVLAVESADRDVVVAVGARIKLVLRSAFGSGS